MSGRTPQGPFYDERYKQNYWYDATNNVYIYENGQRISGTPRTIPSAPGSSHPHARQQAHPQSPRQEAAYVASNTSTQRRMTQDTDAVALQMNNLALSSASTAGDPGQFIPRVYENNGIRMVAAENPANRVRTVIATRPAALFTDPELLAHGVQAHRMLYGTEGDSEPLYSNFKLQRPGFFDVGRVFHVLWAEPAGETRTTITAVEVSDRANPGITTGRHNEKVYSKVRRFVVVRTGGQYCSALPIMTYGRRGVAKPGVAKHEHAIIHTGSEAPEPNLDERPGRDEHPMRPQAIRVVADTQTEKLDPMSRVDFGKVHTIQHNLKVKSFGMVHPSAMQALTVQFGNVWLAQSAVGSQARGNAAESSSQAQAQAQAKARVRAGSSSARSASRTSKSVVSQGSHGKQSSSYAPPRQLRREQANEAEEDEEDENSDDESDDDDEDSDHAENDNRGDHSEVRQTHARSSATSTQDEDNARQARNAMERMVSQGYTQDQAFNAMATKLQSDRSLTREAAYRLMQSWTGYTPTGPSSSSTSQSRRQQQRGSK